MDERLAQNEIYEHL